MDLAAELARRGKRAQGGVGDGGIIVLSEQQNGHGLPFLR